MREGLGGSLPPPGGVVPDLPIQVGTSVRRAIGSLRVPRGEGEGSNELGRRTGLGEGSLARGPWLALRSQATVVRVTVIVWLSLRVSVRLCNCGPSGVSASVWLSPVTAVVWLLWRVSRCWCVCGRDVVASFGWLCDCFHRVAGVVSGRLCASDRHCVAAVVCSFWWWLCPHTGMCAFLVWPCGCVFVCACVYLCHTACMCPCVTMWL